MARGILPGLAVLLGVFELAGCGTDSSGLGGRRGLPEAGSAGAPAADAQAADAAMPPDAGGVSDGSAPDTGAADVDAAVGPSTLTIVHGVSDSPTIAICFARVSTGLTFVGDPFPPGGLSFGQSVPALAVPGFDFETDAVQPVVIAGNLALVAGMSCEQAIAEIERITLELADAGAVGDAGGDASTPDASMMTDAAFDGGIDAGATTDGASFDSGSDATASSDATVSDAATDGGIADAAPDALLPPPPPPPVAPPIRALGMAILPGGTFTGGKNFLFVPTGCLGGPAFTSSVDQIVCGPGYSATSPTLRPVVVSMSARTSPNRLGLQVLNAAATPDRLKVESVPNGSGITIEIVDELVSGAIGPASPMDDFPRDSFGTPITESSIEVGLSNATTAQLMVPWADVLDRGDLTSVANETGYTLVVIGPRAGLSAGSWWNGSTVTIVPNVPF